MSGNSNNTIVSLTENQISRMRSIFNKITNGEISAEEAIDKVLDPTMEDLFPSLMSMDETREAFSTIVGLMPRFAGKEFFVKIKGLDEPKIFKATTELLPRPINIEPASEEEIEDLPGLEFNASLMPLLLKGKIDKLYGAISQTDTVKIHGLPKFAEWFGNKLDLSNFVPLLQLLNRDSIKKIQKQLIPVLDKATENLTQQSSEESEEAEVSEEDEESEKVEEQG